MLDQNTGNLLEAFQTQSAQKQLREPKALSSGQMVPKKSVKRKVRNGLIKLYVNAILIIIFAAVVFVAYRLAVIPKLFPAETTNQNQQTQTNHQVTPQDFQGPATYAETFAFYWLSGNLDVASGYTANGYLFPENVISPVPKEVLWSKIWEVNPIDKNKVNVVIQASVKSASNENTEENNSSTKVVYLSVPLLFENGKYGVYDIPTFLPPPGKATFKEESKSVMPLAKPEQDAINNRVRLFFDEYFGGKPDKIAVYFSDSIPRATLQDAQLKNLADVKIFPVEEGNSNKVLVEVLASTTVDGVDMLQKFRINMTKNGNIWMVNKTDPELPIYNVVKQNNN